MECPLIGGQSRSTESITKVEGDACGTQFIEVIQGQLKGLSYKVFEIQPDFRHSCAVCGICIVIETYAWSDFPDGSLILGTQFEYD